MASANFTDETLHRSENLRPRAQRKSNQHYSKLAEDLVAKFAENRGWDILHRNFRRPGCEIDIIMKKQKTLVILEVKFRKQLNDLTTLVPKKKIEALVRGINRFLASEVHEHDTIRIDLAVVTLINGSLRLAHYLPNIAPE
jgi:putative endonuclease